MLLALALSQYPDELRADFQETYSLNIDELGVAYSVHHASVLCAQLPQTSRFYTAVSAPNAWNNELQLLAWIEYNQRMLMASLSSEGQKLKSEIRPVLPDELIPEDMRPKKHKSMSIEEFDKFINRSRKEVTNG